MAFHGAVACAPGRRAALRDAVPSGERRNEPGARHGATLWAALGRPIGASKAAGDAPGIAARPSPAARLAPRPCKTMTTPWMGSRLW